MKRWIAFIVIALLSGGAIYWAERKKVEAQASPEAMMYLIADSQRELTRLPVAMTKLSDEEEIRIGNEMANGYARWRRPGQESSEDRETREYIEQVGAKVAVHAHRKLPYRFHYIPEPYFVNAFALPGGHVFIGQGLLNLMDSEDELANVLGHEVEHADLGHCVERVQIEAKLRRLNLGIIGVLASIPIELFEAGYSKEQELEADREGTRLAVAGKYSPEGAVRMFETFQQFEPGAQRKPGSPQEEIASVALDSLSEYFRSHPPSAMRAEQIRRLIAEEKWPVTKETDLKVAYLRYSMLADTAYDRRKYKEAIQYAKRSLDVHPRQSNLVRLIARSQFMLGEFENSAQTYRSLLTEYASGQPEDLRSFADALAATRSKSAAAQFDSLISVFQPRSSTMAKAIKVEFAGIHLVSGSPQNGDTLAQALGTSGEEDAPDSLARLAWWYYRAENPVRSAQLFEQAIQLRPQDGRFRAGRAWPEIEQRHYDTALNFYGGDNVGAESTAIRAVGGWLSQNRGMALREFETLANDPAWSNRNWVAGNYSLTVVAAMDQMKHERDQRLAAMKR